MASKTADHSMDMHLYQQLRVNPVKSTKNPELGYGYIKSEPVNGVVKVQFINDKKTVDLPIQDFVNPNDKQELPSNDRSGNTPRAINIDFAAHKEYQPFLEFLWKNAEVLWQGTAEDAEAFSAWYKNNTGQAPTGRGFYVDRPGYRDYNRGEHMRIDWPASKPMTDISVPKELEPTKSGGKFHISSTSFAKQLIEGFGFRLGKQPATNFPGFIPKEVGVDIETPVETEDVQQSPEEARQNAEQFLRR